MLEKCEKVNVSHICFETLCLALKLQNQTDGVMKAPKISLGCVGKEYKVKKYPR